MTDTPRNSRRDYRRGLTMQKAGRWAEAAEAYAAAIAGDANHPMWHYRLGAALEKTKRWSEAVDAYTVALAGDASDPRWHYRLGVALERTQDLLGATQAYRRAERAASAQPPYGVPVPGFSLPITKRIELSLVDKPQYAYCIRKACLLAQQLGVSRIAVLEFGVAGGNGLLAMEAHAATFQAITGVEVDVYGFDTGEGLYEPADVRDLPYFFKQGNYAIDLPQLRSRLDRAQLVLGDAAVTIREFLGSDRAPIGAISFDMDYYSATAGVLRAMDDGAPDGPFLPRVACYFDDVVGKQGPDYNDFTGELLAIHEFNHANAQTKLAGDRSFHALALNYSWYHKIYTMHRFAHPQYSRYISPHSSASLALEP